jgi:hypothetical protein
MVVADLGFSLRLMPRSKTSDAGVPVPKEAMDRFTENGRFYYGPKSVPLSSLRGCDNIGQLPQPFQSDVLELARRRPERRSTR